uniref:Uncharacterized protein n=1 Tax=Zooxanthella nutricula TaxID=1333877 RepID=A0A7S2P6Y7_9DINO
MVSLDKERLALTRLWCVAEIAQAAKTQPVLFQVAELTYEARQALYTGGRLVKPVAECVASNDADRNRILGQIRDADGGERAFDELINTLVEMRFGVLRGLQVPCGHAEEVLLRLRRLEISCVVPPGCLS